MKCKQQEAAHKQSEHQVCVGSHGARAARTVINNKPAGSIIISAGVKWLRLELLTKHSLPAVCCHTEIRAGVGEVGASEWGGRGVEEKGGQQQQDTH